MRGMDQMRDPSGLGFMKMHGAGNDFVVIDSRGREAVEKVLQREGKTATRHEDLASQLGFADAPALFEAVGKDEFSLRTIETFLRPIEPLPAADDWLRHKINRKSASASTGGVLVVGIDALMTELARCCRPAPPDPICGFVTRGKGVSVPTSTKPNPVPSICTGTSASLS